MNEWKVTTMQRNSSETNISNTALAEPDGSAVLRTIRSRRSIGRVTTDVPPRDVIREILEAGTWAPNHHNTEPWRFVVLEGDARAHLGAVMGELASSREVDPERKASAAAKASSKPLRAPYIIAIAVEPSAEPSVPELEEVAAGSAAVQNMLLAAEALGLAAIWRSGWMAFTPEVRAHLGFSERAIVLGFVYVGYAAMERPIRERRSIDLVTTWRDGLV